MALDAKQVAGDNREAIIELVGRSGKNGKVRGIVDDVADNSADITELKKFQLGIVKSAGIGAAGGGGVFYGVIEAIKYFT